MNKLLAPLLFLSASASSHAVLTWTGIFPTNGGTTVKLNALADLNNYSGDKSGLTEAFDNNNGADFSRNFFTTDVIFNGVDLGSINANIRVLPGNFLTLSNSNLTLTSNAGLNTFTGNGPGSSTVNLENSTVEVSSIANELGLVVDADSLATLRGANTPINAGASVALEPGGTVSFTGDPANAGASFVSNTAFAGSSGDSGDTQQFSYTGDYPGNFNGSGTITALPVPEPSATLALLAATPFLLRRKR